MTSGRRRANRLKDYEPSLRSRVGSASLTLLALTLPTTIITRSLVPSRPSLSSLSPPVQENRSSLAAPLRIEHLLPEPRSLAANIVTVHSLPTSTVLSVVGILTSPLRLTP